MFDRYDYKVIGNSETPVSHTAMLSTTHWCFRNPEKKAAILMPHGTYEIVYRPNKDLKGVSHV